MKILRLGKIKFEPELLKSVGLDLIDRFNLDIDDFRVEVKGRTYTVAAHIDLNPDVPVIYMYKPYHDRYPNDFKVTLLHEFGHILFGHEHREFKVYWESLLAIDKENAYGIVPDEYKKFLNSRGVLRIRDKWICKTCDLVKYYKIKVHKSICDICGSTRVQARNFNPIYVEE